MQTKQSNAVMNLLSGSKPIQWKQIDIEGQVTLILRALKDITEILPEFEDAVNLPGVINHQFHHMTHEWVYETNLDSDDCRKAAFGQPRPKGITEETRVIHLDSMCGGLGHSFWEGEVLLTTKGELIFWKHSEDERTSPKKEPNGFNFFTAGVMREHFKEFPSMSYTIYHAICHLPKVHKWRLKNKLKPVKKLSRKIKKRFQLIEFEW